MGIDLTDFCMYTPAMVAIGYFAVLAWVIKMPLGLGRDLSRKLAALSVLA
ncbi:hypothetical protein [Chitinibacter tainanensis]|nr:hypothetical protein [Chitinibacter tainanensis]